MCAFRLGIERSQTHDVLTGVSESKNMTPSAEDIPTYLAIYMAVKTTIPPIARAIRKWMRRTFIIVVIDRKN